MPALTHNCYKCLRRIIAENRRAIARKNQESARIAYWISGPGVDGVGVCCMTPDEAAAQAKSGWDIAPVSPGYPSAYDYHRMGQLAYSAGSLHHQVANYPVTHDWSAWDRIADYALVKWTAWAMLVEDGIHNHR